MSAESKPFTVPPEPRVTGVTRAHSSFPPAVEDDIAHKAARITASLDAGLTARVAAALQCERGAQAERIEELVRAADRWAARNQTLQMRLDTIRELASGHRDDAVVNRDNQLEEAQRKLAFVDSHLRVAEAHAAKSALEAARLKGELSTARTQLTDMRKVATILAEYVRTRDEPLDAVVAFAMRAALGVDGAGDAAQRETVQLGGEP